MDRLEERLNKLYVKIDYTFYCIIVFIAVTFCNFIVWQFSTSNSVGAQIIAFMSPLAVVIFVVLWRGLKENAKSLEAVKECITTLINKKEKD